MPKQTERWVICLGAGASQLPIIESAISLNYKVLAIDQNINSVGFKIAQDYIICSIYEAEKLIQKIKERTYHAVLCRATGQALYTSAYLSRKLKIKGINHQLAQIATSKSALREFSKKNNINMPFGIKTSSKVNQTDFINKFSDMIVIKPDFTVVGKKSIKKLPTKNTEGIKHAIKESEKESGNNKVEIEDYISGYDCSILAWVNKGKFTRLLDWDEISFFNKNGELKSVGISTPSIANESSHINNIISISEKIASKFHNVSSLIAFSFRVHPSGECYLIEMHADFTGDLILDVLMPNAKGINLIKLLTDITITGDISKKDLKFFDLKETIPTAVIYSSNKIKENNKIFQDQSIKGLHRKLKLI